MGLLALLLVIAAIICVAWFLEDRGPAGAVVLIAGFALLLFFGVDWSEPPFFLVLPGVFVGVCMIGVVVVAFVDGVRDRREARRNRLRAREQGYPGIPDVFAFHRSFTASEHPHIAYFADVLEPACEAFHSRKGEADRWRKYREMSRALGSNVPASSPSGNTMGWPEAMDRLIELRDGATVGDVMDHLLAMRRFRLPDAIESRERELREFDPKAAGTMPRALRELRGLRSVPYREIVALCRDPSGPCSTEVSGKRR